MPYGIIQERTFMKIAVISLTENGRKLSSVISEKLSNEFSIKRFCFYKHVDSRSESFDSITELTAQIFESYDALVFVSACGIAVRACAPHIKSKASDPAVIVTDELGHFVIPVLSGHLGRANALAEKIAEKISSVPAVTTATDTGRKFSPDSFALANDLIITDMNAAKEIASAVLEDEEIGFFCDYPYQNLPQELCEGKICRTGIVISTDTSLKPFDVTLNLVPKNLVIGMGCKRNEPYSNICSFISEIFKATGISEKRICALATIDIKSEETGLKKICIDRNIPMYTYTAVELMMVEGNFSSSEFVRKITGADNICERSAVKCSEGPLVIPKTAFEGITLAAAERWFDIDFNRSVI